MMNILVALDSFKGSVSSYEANQAVERGIRAVLPHAIITKLAIADGGEGTVDCLYRSLGGTLIKKAVHNPLMTFIEATYLMLNDKTAVIEMSSAAGLTLITPEKQDPRYTSTYGVGELIHDAILIGSRQFLIGIGGSATNDAGIGMLQALGYRFLDKFGHELPGIGDSLSKIVTIDQSQILPELSTCHFQVASDVDNPLYGPNGAAHVFARQKGANDEIILELDLGLKHFCDVIKRDLALNIKDIPGLGAAGGLGGGFFAFLNTEIKPGIDLIFNKLKLKQNIQQSDLIITGEGRLDFQSKMGKVPAGIAHLAKLYKKPVIAIGGQVTQEAYGLHEIGITALFSVMKGPISLEEAMKKEVTESLITDTIQEIMRLLILNPLQ
jgi:glycerate kinase